jgi:hypothetical protein
MLTAIRRRFSAGVLMRTIQAINKSQRQSRIQLNAGRPFDRNEQFSITLTTALRQGT